MKKYVLSLMAILVLLVVPLASASVYTQLDFFDVGDSTEETAHNAQDWGAINVNGNYAGKDPLDTVDNEGVGNAKDMRVVWGGHVPRTDCTSSNNWASFVMDAGNSEARTIDVRALDGASQDSFSIYIVDNQVETLVGSYTDVDPADDGEATTNWQTKTFSLPSVDPDTGMPYTGVITFKVYSTGVEGPYCDVNWGEPHGYYGQNTISWVQLNGVEQQQQIPEFSAIAAGIALLGSGAAFVALRKRK